MLRDIFTEPLAIEALVAILIALALYFLFRSLKGVAARMSRRRALREFVSGVDLYFKGEFGDSREALEKVLERDPENHEARILLGDACREMDDLPEAHKHHYQVLEVFGQDLPRNRLSLGRDLIAMGRAADAIPHLDRYLEADPDDRKTLELLLDACIEAGLLERAVAVARRLEESADGASAEAARRRHASVCLMAGSARIDGGRTKEGVQLLRSALRLNPALVSPRLELVRSSYLSGSNRAAEKELLQQLKEMARLADDGEVVFLRPGPPGLAGNRDGRASPAAAAPAALPIPAEESRPALPAPESEPRPAQALAVRGPDLPARRRAAAPVMTEAPSSVRPGEVVRSLLPREAVYVCVRCGRGERAFIETCSGCGAFGSLAASDPSPLAAVAEMKEVIDEIEQNRAWVRSLVVRAAAGDAVACDKLVMIGPRVVSGIFRELMRVEDNAALVKVLSALGTEAVPTILDRYRRARAFTTKRLVREGRKAFRSLDSLVVRALCGMGEDVVEPLRAWFEEGEREVRLIALDVFIRLGRAEDIENLRLALSTKDVLDRLNCCHAEELARILDESPEGGFLVEQVFTDRTFSAEGALVAGLRRAGNRGKIRRILISRGFSSGTYEALEVVWDLPGAGRVVSDVVRSFGRSAVDHLMQTYMNPNASEEVREEALRLLLDLGGGEIERLTERLSEGDAETEKAVLRIVRAFGSRAVPALVQAYGKTGLLARVGLNRRRVAYRRITLLRALGEVGTYDAVQALRRIQSKETDPDLKRRVEEIVARLSAGREGA